MNMVFRAYYLAINTLSWWNTHSLDQFILGTTKWCSFSEIEFIIKLYKKYILEGALSHYYIMVSVFNLLSQIVKVIAKVSSIAHGDCKMV